MSRGEHDVVGPTNGTTSNFGFRQEANVENLWVQGDITFCHSSPIIGPQAQDLGPQGVVAESLRRSLKQNAAVWRELAKY